MSSWWNLSQSEIEKFAFLVATEMAAPKPDIGYLPEAALKHRSEYISAIVKTANDLRHLYQTMSEPKLIQRINGLFQRPYAMQTALLICAFKNSRFDYPMSMKSLKGLATVAQRLHNLDEPIHHHAISKSDGGVRHTWEFGRIRYAQQTLMAWILSATLEPSNRDFALPGMSGINGAAQAIGGHLKDFYRFWVTTDLKDAYPSIAKGHIRPHVNVGTKLERYVCFPRLPYSAHSTSTPQPVRRELPQGGAHSSYLLSAVIEGCLASSLPGEVVAIVYSDNIAIGAHTPKAAKCAFHALQAAFASLPGGLQLHSPYLCDGYNRDILDEAQFDAGFRCVNAIDFCGYRISLDQFSDTLQYSPSTKAWKKFWANVEAKHFHPHIAAEQLEEIAFQRMQFWRGGLPLWKPNAAALENFYINAFQRAHQYVEKWQAAA